MEILNNEEMMMVKGGGVGLWGLIGAGIVFLIGVFDGITNPQKCNRK